MSHNSLFSRCFIGAAIGSTMSVAMADDQSTSSVVSTADWSVIGHLALSLVVIVVALLVVRFLLAKWQPTTNRRLSIRILGGVPVGTKEKIIAVDIEDKRLYLGVCPGRITVIHASHRSQEQESEASQPPSEHTSRYFRSLLEKKDR